MDKKIIMNEDEYDKISAQQNMLLELLDLFDYDKDKNVLTINRSELIMDIVASKLKEKYGVNNVVAQYGSGEPVALVPEDGGNEVSLVNTTIEFK
ncbi:hypothetical protein HOS50_gp052 [Lactobacillus phage Lenus]|uniref:Uncharacterized protein n=1 Tax=Lactobacillus phage Lenus TaxID=2053682 RepID=A0A2H4PBI3_9CAUD|nr:hypothetical protein HOS50_gp052 [Lactobacillus phage Lenus]ATW59469.1 hypothetical protein [Lactobacillus phage Lenus]